MLISAPPATRTTDRFTRDGSNALEARLADICTETREALRQLIPANQLEAALLGGGYGRGEGGVLRTPEGDEPYNDLEFYVCLREPRWWHERRFSRPLQALADRLTAREDIHVEFKVISLRHLRTSPANMFYYDLVMGHRWVIGYEALLAGCEHHRDARALPLHEATRLLMNRCSGLLFARTRLEQQPLRAPDADFVGRNLAKAQLGFGDVVLAAAGQYHWSAPERHQRLLRLSGNWPELDRLRKHHAAGVEFKLHPHRLEPGASFAPLLAELTSLGGVLWVWLESRRLGEGLFQKPREYALQPADKCPEQPTVRNWLVNLTKAGPGIACGRFGFRYPRARVLEALALLLWHPESLRHRDVLRQVQARLGTRAASMADLVRVYQTVWQSCN